MYRIVCGSNAVEKDSDEERARTGRKRRGRHSVWVHDHSSITHFHRQWAGPLTVRTDSWFQVDVLFEQIFFRQVTETSRDTKNMVPVGEDFE